MTTPDPTQIPRIPWSQLGPEFAMVWGYADPSNPQPEGMEIIGMTGSGKTEFMMKVLQERMLVRNSRIIIIVTKQDDEVFTRLGWPIVREFKQLKKHRQCIYWPLTKDLGEKRQEFHEKRLYELLSAVWVKKAWLVISFDEIAYAESLSPRVKGLIAMYWREARSMKITVVAMKQRPQGAQRDMHSESYWTVEFVPKDENDAERFAEVFGDKRVWLPVLKSMNPDNHEFLIRNIRRPNEVFISWLDEIVQPIEPPSEQNKLFKWNTNKGSNARS